MRGLKNTSIKLSRKEKKIRIIKNRENPSKEMTPAPKFISAKFLSNRDPRLECREEQSIQKDSGVWYGFHF